MDNLSVSFNDLALGRVSEISKSSVNELSLVSQLGVKPSPADIPPPVLSHLQDLPFNALSWELFEALCAALVQIQPITISCNLFGVQGDEQQGIDIIAKQRGKEGDEIWVYQCKRYKEFTPGKLKEALDRMVYSADFYVLMLSIPATASNRLIVADYKNTYLWDSKDIARKLKSYPVIVEDFFGAAWREAFCIAEINEVLTDAHNTNFNEFYQTETLLSSSKHNFDLGAAPESIPIKSARLHLNKIFAGESNSALWRSIQAVPLETTKTEFMPFDLGAIWGLDRSSFIGIVSSWFDAPIYEQLCLIESTLYKQSHSISYSFSFLPRLWFYIDLNSFLHGPENLKDIYESASDKNSLKIEFLKEESFRNLISLGFYFEINLEPDSPNLLEIVQNWCRQLITNENLRFEQVAIVIYLKSENLPGAKKNAADLRNKIGQLNLQVRTEAMLLKENSLPDYKNEFSKNSILSDFVNPSLPLGYYFTSWVDAAINKAGAQILNNKSETEKYSKVIKAIEKIRQHNPNLVFDSKMSLASQVVEDLAQIVSKTEIEVDDQFLRLVKNYLPNKLFELVRAYGGSGTREEARRQALIFASDLDILIDAWLDGAIDNLAVTPLKNEFKATVSEGPFFNNVVLALLKRFQNGRQQDEIRKIISSVKPYLGGTIRSVAEYCLGEIPRDGFFDKFQSKKILFAFRAGIDIRPLLIKSKEFSVENIDFWRCFFLVSPDITVIKYLLNLEPLQRAVLRIMHV